MIILLSSLTGFGIWSILSPQQWPRIVTLVLILLTFLSWMILRSRSKQSTENEDRSGETAERTANDSPGTPLPLQEVPPVPSVSSEEFLPPEIADLIHEYRALAPRITVLSTFVANRSEIAATQSTESAFSMAEEARKASARVTDLLDNVNCGENCLESRISTLREQLSQFGVLIKDLTEMGRMYTKDLTEMDNLAGQVTRFTESIQDIAERTGILSINASIEAARAGDSGKGFSVIAHEVRKLSESTREITDRIATLLNEFGSSVNRSVKDSTFRLESILSGINGTRTVLDSSVEALVPQVESVALSVKEAEGLTGSLSSRLEDVTIWFQTQDALRQVIEHISDAVTDLATRYEDSFSETVPPEIDRRTEKRLTERFTMSDEWEAMNLDPPENDGNITLF